MKPLRVALIGCGSSARLQASAFSLPGRSQVVAVCGRGRERAEALSGELGVPAYFSAGEMLQRERPDVVSVTTGEYDHELPVSLALEAGCHVFCEKILAESLAAGERMVAAARAAGRCLGVNYNYRTIPAYEMLRGAIRGGAFGDPALFVLDCHAYLYPHWLDLIRHLFGEPAELSGTLVDDPALRPVLSRASGQRWEFRGEMLYHPSAAVSACLRYRNPDFAVTIGSSAAYELAGHWWSFTFIGRRDWLIVQDAVKESLAGRASGGKLAERWNALSPCSYAETFRRSVDGFVAALLEGRPPPVTGEDALQSMRLDAAIVRAATR